jgi:hypothetical protein
LQAADNQSKRFRINLQLRETFTIANSFSIVHRFVSPQSGRTPDPPAVKWGELLHSLTDLPEALSPHKCALSPGFSWPPTLFALSEPAGLAYDAVKFSGSVCGLISLLSGRVASAGPLTAGGDGVRKAMGPVLTTGVALVAAAVVVANPVAPPVRDFQISTTQLSTSPGALIPFDKNLLKSISQMPASSTFNTALTQILSALAAEADRIGTEVNSNVSSSLTPPAASQTPPVYAPLSADVAPGPTPNATAPPSTIISPASATASTPTFQQVVSDITADTAYLSNKVVEAASAAVDALVNTPDLLFKAVQAALLGDLKTAFATIVEAIKAFFDPGRILFGGIDVVIGQYVVAPTDTTPSASAAAVNNAHAATPPATAAGEGTSATEPETTAAEAGSGKKQTKSTGSARHATTDPTSSIRPQLAPGVSATAPGSRNSSRSAESADSGSAEQPKAKGPGADKPSGRLQNAGGRGSSAGD